MTPRKPRGPYKNSRSQWVQPGTLCACGCGELVPTRHPCGAHRYVRAADGKAYLKGHHGKTRIAERAPNWKGGRYVHHGYVHVYRPDYQSADQRGYILEHRLVWEEANGRELGPDEDVHHINGDKADNRPENLVALTKARHSKVEGHNPNSHATSEQLAAAGRTGSRVLNFKRWGVTPEEAWETLVCAECGASFTAWKKRQRRYCSNVCAAHARSGKPNTP